MVSDHEVCVFGLTVPDIPDERVFTDACKGVIQRCIFLLLGVRTSFPLHDEMLSVIANSSKTAPSDGHGLDVTFGGGPLHVVIDDSLPGTPVSLSPNASPAISPRVRFELP